MGGTNSPCADGTGSGTTGLRVGAVVDGLCVGIDGHGNSVQCFYSNIEIKNQTKFK